MPALLEATSELEGKEVGYLASRVANDASIQEKLDMARIAAAKSSPLMECVNFVIQFVDDGVLTELVPRLVDLIKTRSLTQVNKSFFFETLLRFFPGGRVSVLSGLLHLALDRSL